jgi:hypothetical protein
VTPPGGRGTRSGSTLDAAIEATLTRNGFGIEKQKYISMRPNGDRHKVDIAVTRPNGTKFLVSLKWQEVGGIAEEKIFLEVIKLLHVLRENGGLYDKTYIVSEATGFSEGMLNLYETGQYRMCPVESDKIEVLQMNEAIRRANRAAL